MPAPIYGKAFMRPDMNKILVERPRILRAAWNNKKTSERLSLDRCGEAMTSPEDFDSGPRRASSARHSKPLNENLAPLKRYLQKQVGRPWRKIYGEVLAAVDTRSAIGLHVMQHVDDFVAQEVEFFDRVPHYRWRGHAIPVRGLYVHPKTGLLREHRIPRERWFTALSPDAIEVVWISQSERFEKRNGLWFRIVIGVRDSETLVVRKQQCGRKTIQKIERGEYGPLVRAEPLAV